MKTHFKRATDSFSSAVQTLVQAEVYMLPASQEVDDSEP